MGEKPCPCGKNSQCGNVLKMDGMCGRLVWNEIPCREFRSHATRYSF